MPVFNDSMSANAIAQQAGNNYQTALALDEALNDTNKQNKNITTAMQQQSAIQNAYDQGVKQGISNVYDTNLKNNPLGNLNNMSADDTLAASRAADAYNNRLRYMQGDIGARTFTMGSTGIADPTINKVAPIETQEMRQMRANESIDNLVRQQQANLAADIERHGLDLQAQKDQNILTIAQQYGITNPNIASAMRQMGAELSWGNPTRLAQEIQSRKFLNYIQANFGHATAEFYSSLMMHNPALAYIAANSNGVALPTYQTALVNKAFQEELQRHPDMDSRQLLQAMNGAKFSLDAITNGMMTEAMLGNMWGLTGYNSMVGQSDKRLDKIGKYEDKRKEKREEGGKA